MLAAWVRTANRSRDATAQQIKRVRPDPSRLLDVAAGRLTERRNLRRRRCAAAFHVRRRHAYGSRLASKGLTARAIADAMGHKRTATTEIYIQRFNGDQSDENIRKAMTG